MRRSGTNSTKTVTDDQTRVIDKYKNFRQEILRCNANIGFNKYVVADGTSSSVFLNMMYHNRKKSNKIKKIYTEFGQNRATYVASKDRISFSVRNSLCRFS